MFVEKPSMKKGMEKPGKTDGAPMKGKDTMEDYSRIGGEGMKDSMKHCSKLLAGKKLEPKQKNGREYFPNPKGK